MANTPTVLIVDDDKAIQKLLIEHLNAEGFTAVAEKDGEWALKTFDARPVDCVILDLLIPVMNGFQVAERIRGHPRGAKVPIVMISGIYRSAQHRAEARQKYGVVDYVDKPFDLDKITGVLKRIFGDRYPNRAEAAAERAAIDARPADKMADEEAREEVRQVDQEARTFGTSSVISAKGDLAQTPFAELLAEIYRWRSSGALLLRREKIKKIIYFRDGRPVFIKSNLLQECLGKVMVREKMISEAECEESIRRMKESGRQQGTILIEMGRISPHNLVFALELQLQQKLWEVFTWAEGEYQFNPRSEQPPSTVQLELTAAAIIYEGLRRTHDDDRIRDTLGDVDALFVHPSPDPLHLFQEVGLDGDEMELLQSIDGSRTVRDVVERSPLGESETYRFLYAMRCAQVIELREAPAEARAMPPPPPPDADEDMTPSESTAPIPAAMAHPSPPPRPAAPHPPAPPAPPRKRSGVIPEIPTADVDVGRVSAEDRDVREKLVAQVQAMKKMDYFQILGVPRTATRDEVKRAYFALAKEYHPDKHYGSASAEVRNLAGEVFALIGSAHDTLVDDEERERYLEDLSHGVKKHVSDEVSRILAAEGKFERGEEFLRNRQFREAYTAFREAVEIYPDEGEFHAFLGWSLFQCDPKDEPATQKAMDSIERAIRLNPKVDKAYLFLGYIFKASGRPDKAEKQFEKAIQCNPDCTEALRELRLLGKQKRT